jgi:hypothetical protein
MALIHEVESEVPDDQQAGVLTQIVRLRRHSIWVFPFLYPSAKNPYTRVYAHSGMPRWYSPHILLVLMTNDVLGT